MKKYLFLISLFLLMPSIVYANNSATIDITSSKEDVSVGDTITTTVTINSDTPIGYYSYTLDYNPNKLKLLSASSYIVDSPNNNNTKKIKKDFKLKVIDKGTSKISVKSYAITSFSDENKINVKINPVTISTEGLISTYSNNNYLSTLKIDNYKLNPTFNKKTLNYKLNLNSDIEKINIVAKAESDKASVTGDGEISLLEGENKVEITVTSESGKEKIYTILITVKDENPIKVKINDKEYTLVKNISALEIPEGYKAVKIKIDSEEVGALYSDITKYTLVGLKDENGNIRLYIYDEENNTYAPYNEIVFNKISFLPLETNETLEGYQTYNETINKVDLECYKLSSNSDYCIIYGMNINTGEKGWYSYNKKEESIQKYNNELFNVNNEKIKNSKILIYILSATTLIFGITTITLAIKKTKTKYRK